MRTILRQGYITARQWVRGAIINNPTLDRWVGYPLRRLERHVNLRWVLSLDRGGVLECHGFKIAYRPEDAGVVTMIKLYGDYEPETRELLDDLLQPGMTFVDGGAHIGYFSLLAGRKVGPEGRVYAFEPVPETRELLEKNVRANGLQDVVDSHGYAVSEEPGSITFVINAESSVSSKMLANDGANGRLVEIPTISLDAFFEQQGWPRCDVVKLDIEGAELPAFRGMKQLAARNPALKLIFEFHVGNLERTDTPAKDLFDALADLGFDRYHVLHRTLTEIQIPEGIDELVALAKRGNVNVVAQRRSP